MNNSKLLRLCSFVVLAVVAFQLVEEAHGGGKGGKGGGGGGMMAMMAKMKCKDEALKMPENMKDVWKGCMEKNKPAKPAAERRRRSPDGDEAEGKGKGKGKGKGRGKGKGWGMGKHTCVQVCVLKEQKVLDADGKYSSDGADALIKSIYPASAQADIKKAMDACNTEHGSTFSMDKDCEGYSKFAQCQKKASWEVCGFKDQMKALWGKGKGKGDKGKKGGDDEAAAAAADEE